MKKLKLRCKFIVLSLILFQAILCIMPQAHAQTDGFFSGGWNSMSGGDINGTNNNNEWGSLSGGDINGTNGNAVLDPWNEEDPTEADLDGGLLILLVAGTSYLLIRNKQKLLIKSRSVKKMKKINILLILALAAIFVQCKKDDKSIASPAEPVVGTEYTLSLTAGSNGAKTEIDGYTVTWTAGDIIYVGNSSGYIGSLTLASGAGTETGTFDGTVIISDPIGVDGMTLHFYYLGETARTIAAGTASFEIDFSSQDGTLDGITQNFHVGYGSTTIQASDVNNSYLINASATFDAKIAIAYMNLDAFAGENVFLTGENVMNKMTVNFQTGVCSNTSRGTISLGTAGAGKYIALVPVGGNATTLTFSSPSKYSTVEFKRGIEANKIYSNNGEAIAFTSKFGLPGSFSVAADKRVHFSRGNLQYKASPATWRFAENQYDYVGDATLGTVYENEEKCNNELIAESYDGWIDLFGWGTSGWNSGATAYQPYSTSITNSSYSPGGPNNTNNLTDDYANSDWGVYNAISNGGNQAGMWRTLTKDEWVYLINTRTDASDKCSQATVCEVPGLVILPDDWAAPTGIALTVNPGNYTSNDYDASQWSSMEQAGAVFLPAAGYRGGSSVSNVGSYGYYFSSSCNGTSFAYKLLLASGRVEPDNSGSRFDGRSVRLVADN